MSFTLQHATRHVLKRGIHSSALRSVTAPSFSCVRSNNIIHTDRSYSLLHLRTPAVMSSQQTRQSSLASSSSSSPPAAKMKREVPEPRPSSSIILLSPTNEVLLLHRVKTSTSFASAHVFPGGNLDPFHDGDIPAPGSPERHQDGPAYRMGAIRECFEETGILLAKKDGALIDLPQAQRDEARKKIHGGQIKFGDWLREIGAEADTDGLLAFTRWITPISVGKRFTTQMYIYMLPISRSSVPSEMLVPTPDGGVEHTAAVFAPAQSFLSRSAAGDIILFPPQYYLMQLLTKFLTGPTASLEEAPLHFMAQRKKVLAFLRRVPTAETDGGKAHPTSQVAWKDKVMSPYHLFIREGDGRVVLGLEKPGLELKGSDRAGDWDRVVLVSFGKGGPSKVEVRLREDILKEEKGSGSGDSKL